MLKSKIAVGYLPYEPLDKIKLKGDKRIYRIRDIVMTQYVVARKIEFFVQVSYAGQLIEQLVNAELIEKRIISK